MLRHWEGRVGIALVIFSLALIVGTCFAPLPVAYAWDDEDCRKVAYQHPDCQTPKPSATVKPTPIPSITPILRTPAPTEPPRIPPTRPPFTIAPSPTSLPPVTTTPRPIVRLPSTATVPYDPGMPQ